MTGLAQRLAVVRPHAVPGAALLVLGLVLGLAGTRVSAAGAPAPRPRLITVIVVDGLPQRQLLAYRGQFAADGFARFFERGQWFANAHYDHAHTVTAAGHAVLLSGATPERSGIIGNEWRDLQTGAGVYCVQDSNAHYIGHATQAHDGTSPKNLLVETVGDVLRRAEPRAKVLAISGKDRGAILPAGRAGTAYIYMAASGQFASSSYYMAAHPPWVDRFNAARPADRYFRASWSALLPASAYVASTSGEPAWAGAGDSGLPITYGAAQDDAPGARFYGSLARGPFGDALALDFARAAVAGERLGQDAVPDILVVSLSGHDYVNHAWSAESAASHDHTLQLDRLLQAFFKDLDAMVGVNRHLLVLTSDHGFMPAPEYSTALGLNAGRLDPRQLLAAVNTGLAQQFGPGKWVRGLSAASLLLDHGLATRQQVSLDALAQQAKALLLAQTGVAAAYTRAELLAGQGGELPFYTAMRKAWHAGVSGDVQFVLKPHWMLGAGSAGTTHGSPHSYDTHVPLMFWGPHWVSAATVAQPVGMVDLAPTLARLLQLAAPADSAGTARTLLPGGR